LSGDIKVEGDIDMEVDDVGPMVIVESELKRDSVQKETSYLPSSSSFK
jgi:hypothetical protein